MKALIEFLAIPPESIGNISPDIPFLLIPTELLRSAVNFILAEDKTLYLSSIIGQEWDERIDLIYFFVGKAEIALRFDLPLNHPKIKTISDILIGTAFYERECHEMLGIIFEGLENSENLLLPKDIHDFPLRKKFAGGEQ